MENTDDEGEQRIKWRFGRRKREMQNDQKAYSSFDIILLSSSKPNGDFHPV